MDNASASAGTPSTTTGGTGNKYLNYFLLFIAIVSVVGIGYWAFGSRTNIMPAKPTDPNDPLNKKIPGIADQSAGSKALGVLTDKNFFDGIANLANSFYGIAKDAKASKQTGAAAFDGPVTQQQAQAGATWGGMPYV